MIDDLKAWRSWATELAKPRAFYGTVRLAAKPTEGISDEELRRAVGDEMCRLLENAQYWEKLARQRQRHV